MADQEDEQLLKEAGTAYQEGLKEKPLNPEAPEFKPQGSSRKRRSSRKTRKHPKKKHSKKTRKH